ncbi:metal-dependent hydrolase [Vibrio fortis]|uniref:metal-dependent hydrolase n=1 Tax=Vibrio fortis TaxID=212667 RepID=UPI0040698AA8
MTGKGHTLCGIFGGIAPAAIAYESTSSIVPALFAYAACVIGSTAPDWMEIPLSKKQTNKDGTGEITVQKTLIPHRTWTHIICVWFALCVGAYGGLGNESWFNLSIDLGPTNTSFLLGFTYGGLLHLFGDLPNKQKIPIFTPWDGIALNLWKSGRFEKTLVGLVVLMSGIWTNQHFGFLDLGLKFV